MLFQYAGTCGRNTARGRQAVNDDIPVFLFQVVMVLASLRTEEMGSPKSSILNLGKRVKLLDQGFRGGGRKAFPLSLCFSVKVFRSSSWFGLLYQ